MRRFRSASFSVGDEAPSRDPPPSSKVTRGSSLRRKFSNTFGKNYDGRTDHSQKTPHTRGLSFTGIVSNVIASASTTSLHLLGADKPTEPDPSLYGTQRRGPTYKGGKPVPKDVVIRRIDTATLEFGIVRETNRERPPSPGRRGEARGPDLTAKRRAPTYRPQQEPSPERPSRPTNALGMNDADAKFMQNTFEFLEQTGQPLPHGASFYKEALAPPTPPKAAPKPKPAPIPIPRPAEYVSSSAYSAKPRPSLEPARSTPILNRQERLLMSLANPAAQSTPTLSPMSIDTPRAPPRQSVPRTPPGYDSVSLLASSIFQPRSLSDSEDEDEVVISPDQFCDEPGEIAHETVVPSPVSCYSQSSAHPTLIDYALDDADRFMRRFDAPPVPALPASARNRAGVPVPVPVPVVTAAFTAIRPPYSPSLHPREKEAARHVALLMLEGNPPPLPPPQPERPRASSPESPPPAPPPKDPPRPKASLDRSSSTRVVPQSRRHGPPRALSPEFYSTPPEQVTGRSPLAPSSKSRYRAQGQALDPPPRHHAGPPLSKSHKSHSRLPQSLPDTQPPSVKLKPSSRNLATPQPSSAPSSRNKQDARVAKKSSMESVQEPTVIHRREVSHEIALGKLGVISWKRTSDVKVVKVSESWYTPARTPEHPAPAPKRMQTLPDISLRAQEHRDDNSSKAHRPHMAMRSHTDGQVAAIAATPRTQLQDMSASRPQERREEKTAKASRSHVTTRVNTDEQVAAGTAMSRTQLQDVSASRPQEHREDKKARESRPYMTTRSHTDGQVAEVASPPRTRLQDVSIPAVQRFSPFAPISSRPPLARAAATEPHITGSAQEHISIPTYDRTVPPTSNIKAEKAVRVVAAEEDGSIGRRASARVLEMGVVPPHRLEGSRLRNEAWSSEQMDRQEPSSNLRRQAKVPRGEGRHGPKKEDGGFNGYTFPRGM
ncbi:hypothetical protein BDW22DRAFT_226322 [Trametopsis cervina]|nr:hypothetical protein BDW22DRAFT_226322 [Trametopsis cervina]